MAEPKIKIRKDDNVQVIAGKDKGKRGRVLKIERNKQRVIVQGVNIIKKAMRRKTQQDRGGIMEVEAGLHLSNVMVLCKKCGPTRIGFNVDGKTKQRICKKCGEAL